MLKENDINFRGLVNDINIGIYVCDLSGKLIYTNHALANILGYERPEDIIGKNLVDYFSPSNKREKSILFNKSLTDIYNSTSITADINKEDGTVAKIEIVSMSFIKSGKLMGVQGDLVATGLCPRFLSKMTANNIQIPDSVFEKNQPSA